MRQIGFCYDGELEKKIGFNYFDRIAFLIKLSRPEFDTIAISPKRIIEPFLNVILPGFDDHYHEQVFTKQEELGGNSFNDILDSCYQILYQNVPKFIENFIEDYIDLQKPKFVIFNGIHFKEEMVWLKSIGATLFHFEHPEIEPFKFSNFCDHAIKLDQDLTLEETNIMDQIFKAILLSGEKND